MIHFRIGLAVVSVAVVLATDGDAHADAPVDAAEPAPPSRQVVFEGQMGGHAPLGQFGFAVDADVVPWLSLSAGVGMDSRMTNNDYFNISPRLVFMPRARLALERWKRTAVGAGIGIVYGERADQVGAASRAIGELSLEHQSLGGVRVRAFAGLGALLGPAAPTGGAGHKAWRPHVGLALGYALAPNPTVTPEDSLSIRRWYGWQGLALDAANAAILGLWQDSDYNSRGTALRASAAIYFVSGPTVHVAHRNTWQALASAAGRLSLPLLFAKMGDSVMTGDSGNTQAGPGAIVGAVVAAVCDDVFLAWERPGQRD